MNGKTDSTRIMLNISIWRKKKKDLLGRLIQPICWCSDCTRVSKGCNASLDLVSENRFDCLNCVVSRAQFCPQNDLPVIDKNWVDHDIHTLFYENIVFYSCSDWIFLFFCRFYAENIIVNILWDYRNSSGLCRHKVRLSVLTNMTLIALK